MTLLFQSYLEGVLRGLLRKVHQEGLWVVRLWADRLSKHEKGVGVRLIEATVTCGRKVNSPGGPLGGPPGGGPRGADDGAPVTGNVQ